MKIISRSPSRIVLLALGFCLASSLVAQEPENSPGDTSQGQDGSSPQAVAAEVDSLEDAEVDSNLAPEGAAAGGRSDGESSAPTFARRVRVRLPITGSADLAIKQVVQQIISEAPQDGERPLIVFEFWAPPGSDGAGSEFERCLSLARFLIGRQLQRVRTVAYIPRVTTGHAVLAVLACEQLIMSPDAKLGNAGAGESVIGPTMRGGYTEISRSRRTIPEAIALGMLDAELEISRVQTDLGTLYAWQEELKRIRAERNDLQSVETLIPAGQMGMMRGDELRQMEFVSYLASSQQEVAERLNIPVGQLEFDPSLGSEWRPIRIELDGPVTAQAVERVQRAIQQQTNVNDANFVLLQLDSPGGSVLESTRLANYLAELDPSQIRTVAYVTREARADAAIVAFACDHLVIHPSAVFGGDGAVRITEEDASDLLSPIREIAVHKNKTWSLIAAIVNPEIQVHRYTQAGREDSLYLCAEEYAERFGADRAASAWKKGEPVTMPQQTLQMDGQQAQVLGLARFVVDNFDEMLQLYQLSEQPTLIGPNWAFDLVNALASPQLSGLLLFIGGFALMSELSSPGIGIGGFLAAVCYMLFFWSNFLHGTAEVLEVMLFLTGLACIIIEVFLLPGLGVFGLGGAALVLASLVLASQTFIFPTNDYQLSQLSRSMMTVAMAGAGVFSAAILLRKYIHRVPWLGNLMLLPPDEESRMEREARETIVDHRHLVGRHGTVRTQLTPSGKIVIDDEVYNAVSDGELIEKDCKVEVTEAWGNRIVVRRAEQ